MRGEGAKGCLNFSENSSVFVASPVPKGGVFTSSTPLPLIAQALISSFRKRSNLPKQCIWAYMLLFKQCKAV